MLREVISHDLSEQEVIDLTTQVQKEVIRRGQEELDKHEWCMAQHILEAGIPPSYFDARKDPTKGRDICKRWVAGGFRPPVIIIIMKPSPPPRGLPPTRGGGVKDGG